MRTQLVSTNQSSTGDDTEGLVLASLPSLTSLSGLGRITTLGNGLVLENLPALSSLAGLSTANLTLRNLTLSDLPQVKSLSELFNTGSGSLLPASLKLTYLPSLVSLKGLERYTQVSNLVLLHNAALSDVTALSKTKFTGPLLLVDDNGSLCDFAGLKDTAAQVNGSQVFNTCGKATTNVNGSTTAPVSRNAANALSLGPLFLTLLSFALF